MSGEWPVSVCLVCDGCTDVVSRAAITGSRTDGWSGAGLPSGEFHWCHECARVAFEAVKQVQAAAAKRRRHDNDH
jgi:hypothetical protein